MDDIYLVVGLGSMGKRRVRDLMRLGVGRVVGVDRRGDRRQEVQDKFGAETLDDFNTGLGLKPRAVIVSVPPHLHYRFCRAALDAGAVYFVECLTALTMEEIDSLVAQDAALPGRAYPSCTNLMNEHAQHSAQALKRLGKIYSIHVSMSSWLPNQHPWEKQAGDHYEFHRDQGGGLAEPAFQLSWISNILGRMPVRVSAQSSHVSDLPSGFSDLLDMIIEFDDGMALNFHYSLCEKHDGSVGVFTRFSGAGGTVQSEPCRSRFYDSGKREWEEYSPSPNWTYEESYLLEMRHFIGALNGNEAYQGNLQIERQVLALLLAAEESSKTGRAVEVEQTSNRLFIQ